MMEWNEFDVKTTYGTLHVYQKGCGKNIVLLLHGGGADSAMLSWREVLETLDENCTVYAPDLLGHGKSDAYETICGAHFYEIHIDSIKQLVDALQIKDFILSGLSMGGAIAIGFALQYPGDVKGLLPVASWGLSAKMPMHAFSYWYIRKTNMTLAQYRWLARSRALAKWSIAYSLIGHKEKITDALVEEVMAACKGDQAGLSMQNFQRSSATKSGTIPYYIDRLGELRMPVVYLAGERDPLVPKADLENAAAHTPQGRLLLLAGCKHWAVKELPGEFCKQVNALQAENA